MAFKSNSRMVSSEVRYEVIDGPYLGKPDDDFVKVYITQRVYEAKVEYDRVDGSTGTSFTRSSMDLNVFFMKDGKIEVWKEIDETTKLPSRMIQEETAAWASNL